MPAPQYFNSNSIITIDATALKLLLKLMGILKKPKPTQKHHNRNTDTHTHAVLWPLLHYSRYTHVSRCTRKGDLLEQPLDFFEMDILPATQSIKKCQCSTENPVILLPFVLCDMVSAPHV